MTAKVAGFTSGNYAAVTGLAYDSTNKKLGLKVGADTVIPFSHADLSKIRIVYIGMDTGVVRAVGGAFNMSTLRGAGSSGPYNTLLTYLNPIVNDALSFADNSQSITAVSNIHIIRAHSDNGFYTDATVTKKDVSAGATWQAISSWYGTTLLIITIK